MTARALVPLALAVALGCGSRTGTLDREPALDSGPLRPDGGGFDASGLDADRRDAGRPTRDAESPDAGASCSWRIGAGPFVVFEETGGAFSTPVVLRNDSRTDLFATHSPADPGQRPRVLGSQLTAALTPTPPVEVDLGPNELPATFTQFAGLVTGCSTIAGMVRVDSFAPIPTYPRSSSRPIGAYDRCLGVAGTPTRMAVATSRGGVPFVSLIGMPGGLGMPALSDPARQVPISVTAVDDALVWVSPSGMFGEVEVSWSDAAGVRRFEVTGFPRADFIQPTLASWPFAPGALAIVAGGATSRLAVVDATGAVRLRSERIPGQMFERPLPALAPARGGLLLARLNFGDIDPQGGLLELSVIGREGEARDLGVRPIPVRRPSASEGGEVSAAGDEVTTIVHWSGVEAGRPVTRALVLACE